jgi:hypothetical protein
VTSRRALLPALVIGALALAGCDESPTGIEARIDAIEERLLASCSCHPKKIEGLDLERSIRADIRAGLLAGEPEDEILWAVLMRHGTALLEAGQGDVQLRANLALAETALVVLWAAGVLLLQLRRRSGLPR